jgi:hypothetical protein
VTTVGVEGVEDGSGGVVDAGLGLDLLAADGDGG